MYKLNIFGQLYDDSEPAFFETDNPDFLFNRIDKKLYERTSLEAQAALIGYVFDDGEIGYPSEEFTDDNLGYLQGTEPVEPPVVNAPITASADQTLGTVTIGGGPADGEYTVTITIDLTGADEETINYTSSVGETSDEIAIGLGLQTVTGGSAVVEGSIITYSSDEFSVVTLSVEVA